MLTFILMESVLKYGRIDTPIGEMIAIVSDQGLLLLEFVNRKELSKEIDQLENAFESKIELGEHLYIDQLSAELQAYFEGKLENFTVPLIFSGTDFQKKVWEALLKIPYAETRSYMEQTRVLGDPKAIRAVASANGKNKIAIIVPCHRVIGSDGSLTGYAGGIDKKRYLLNLERKFGGPKDLFSQ